MLPVGFTDALFFLAEESWQQFTLDMREGGIQPTGTVGPANGCFHGSGIADGVQEDRKSVV